ncbi:hypothetical protein ACJMK2_007792 [Sinanodonta woodiana]|uniref:Uncharacterized protein n=1 Tax=Sinanodonta woodiana TaxID=1069815 RepID=A0ABD3VJK4_SINWO
MERFYTLLLVCFISTVLFQIVFSAHKTPGRQIRQVIIPAGNATSTNKTPLNATSSSINAGQNETAGKNNATSTVASTGNNATSNGASGVNNATSNGNMVGYNAASNGTLHARNGNNSEVPTPRNMFPLLVFVFLQISLVWN